MNKYRRPIICAAVALVLSSLPVNAQVAEPGACPVTVVPPGASHPDDRTIHRCNLDRRPALVSSVETLPSPMYWRQAHGTIRLFVDPDGRVIRDLTRYMTLSGDTLFHRQLLEAVQALEFEVGTVQGEPVRFASELAIATDLRSDLVPERLTWRHAPGILRDSLVGTWERAEPEPPLSSDQVASIARSVTRTLRAMHVLVPEHGQPYCIRFEGPERQAVQAAIREELSGGSRAWGMAPLGPTGCEFDVNYRRFRLDAPVQTGGGRVALSASGDFLERWPPGLDGRWWRAWTADCVVPESSGDLNGTECSVAPVWTGDRSIDSPARRTLPEPADAHVPVQILVEVTTSGAFRTDTVRASVAEVPRLEERTSFRRDVSQCRSGAALAAGTDRPTDDEFAMWFRLPVDSYSTGQLRVFEIRGRPADARFGGIRCDEADAFQVPMALFTLGGVGHPLRAPMRFCVNEPECAQPFELEPGVHELAAEPHAVFRLGDLREAAKRGDHVRFRLHIDRRIEGLVPFVVIRSPDRMLAWLLREREGTAFDFRVNHTPRFSPDTEFWIYLMTVDRP